MARRPIPYRMELAYQIHDLLDLPLDRNGGPGRGKKIIQAILDSMITALHNNEDVSIPGFGIFRIQQWKPRRTGNNFVAGPGTYSPVPLTAPARKKVAFIPSEQLEALVNIDSPNTYQNKRAMKQWDC